MKNYIIICIAVVMMCRCGNISDGKHQGETTSGEFRIEHINGMTPVKNQGAGSGCWAYAMLAAIETTHISMGDSVNLSPSWAIRVLMEDLYMRNVLSQGGDKGTTRATGMTLLNIIQRHGIVPYDSYPDRNGMGVSTSLLLNKTRLLAEKAVNARKGYKLFMPAFERMMDESIGYTPKNVYMLGAQYTPLEFAHSVCRPDEYIAMASCTHHPFGEWFILESADNWERSKFYNVPIDHLMRSVEKAVRSGMGVCWEGDISESGFCFSKGIATLDMPQGKNVQQLRQTMIESYTTTDDHCMAIVGIARDKSGKKYFIMKNSWGTGNPYKGLMYLSEDYLKLKTIAVFLPRLKAE